MRVVIIGGGFGGLTIAKELHHAKVDLFVIDKTNHHLFQPLLYQVATAGLSPSDIAVPIREILRHQDNTSVVMGEVVDIDKEKKHVILGNGDHFEYDYLVIAVGAHHNYFGHSDWAIHAPGLKTLENALNIRQQVLISFEKAERLDSISQASKFLNFVVIGGGPTGVEMAGAIAEVAHKTMFKNFRRIKPEKSNVYLIEATHYILPSYPNKLSKRAQKTLEEMGVNVITGKMVTNINEEGVQVGDEFIPSQNVIWAAGTQAPKLLKSLGTSLDPQGRVLVEPDLTIPGHPDIFVIGDAAHVPWKNGMTVPGVSPAAIQEGRYVAKILHHKVPQNKRRPFKYFDKGMMATIGKNHAVVGMGKLQFSGTLAWLAWCFIHIFYLIGFRNRIIVMIQWLTFYITGRRGSRLIYRSLERELTGKHHTPTGIHKDEA